MAAVTELSFLLFALISNIHADSFIILKEMGLYTFRLPKEANCVISRSVGEEKLVLWNNSDLWSQNSTLPEDLKQRLSVVTEANISSYVINNLNHSDSGPYQKECRIDGTVTYEENFSFIICSKIDKMMSFSLRIEENLSLPCLKEADNLDFQWLKREFRYGQEIWTRVFGDNTTSGMDNVKRRYQVNKNTSTLRIFNFTTTDFTVFTCLVMDQQQCVSSQPVTHDLEIEHVYGSVEETAVLPCTVTNSTDDLPPRWFNLNSDIDLGQENHTVPSVDKNFSLVFSSLTLNHSSWYYCETSMRMQIYGLLVCPKFGPPAVELFSEGEDVTLRCKDRGKGVKHLWFVMSKRKEGILLRVFSDLSRLSWYYHNLSLVISNVSLKDAGEYWCAVLDADDQCLSSTKTLMQYRDPFGFHSTFYKVRCSVLSVLLLMLCVVVVAVNQWTRRGEQLHPDP